MSKFRALRVPFYQEKHSLIIIISRKENKQIIKFSKNKVLTNSLTSREKKIKLLLLPQKI